MMYYIWIDHLGVPCAILVNKALYHSYGTPSEQQIRVTVNDVQLRLVPDKTSFRHVCPWDTKLSMCFANLEKNDGTPYELCGRTLLRRMCAELRNQFGLDMRCGFDLRFNLLKEVKELHNELTTLDSHNSKNYSIYSLFSIEEDLVQIIH